MHHFPSRSRTGKAATASLALLACLGLAACSSDESTGANPPPNTNSSSNAAADPTPTFDEAQAKADIEKRFTDYKLMLIALNTADPTKRQEMYKQFVTDNYMSEYVPTLLTELDKRTLIPIGTPKLTFTFQEIKPNEATFRVCEDQSNMKYRNIVTEEVKGTEDGFNKYGITVTMKRQQDGRWFVDDDKSGKNWEQMKQQREEACNA